MTDKAAYLYHDVEQAYTTAYIDKMWHISRLQPFPEKDHFEIIKRQSKKADSAWKSAFSGMDQMQLLESIVLRAQHQHASDDEEEGNAGEPVA